MLRPARSNVLIANVRQQRAKVAGEEEAVVSVLVGHDDCGVAGIGGKRVPAMGGQGLPIGGGVSSDARVERAEAVSHGTQLAARVWPEDAGPRGARRVVVVDALRPPAAEVEAGANPLVQALRELLDRARIVGVREGTELVRLGERHA